MQKTKTKLNKISLTALGLILIYILVYCSSCEKKEPKNSPLPEKLMADVINSLELSEAFSGIAYSSEIKDQNLSEEKAKELYSEKGNDKNNQLIDMSKIEKYSIILGTDTSPNEICIFRLYGNSASTEYVKNMAKNRILSVQRKFEGDSDDISGVSSHISTANSGEARSYGNYVYYVIHPEKDKIFEKIENVFKDEDK